MAFDIYAGTFTRFFTRDWENVVQRQARLDGTEYRMIYAGGETPPPSPEEVREVVAAWKAGINGSLAQDGHAAIEWSEDDGQPYFTDRPAWEGYAGLLLWAAYAEKPEAKPPHFVPESWAADRVWQEVMERDAIHFRSILQATLWLPGDFRFCFGFPSLTGDDDEEVMIASTGGLLAQLRELGQKPLQWQSQGLFSKLRRNDGVPLEEAAQWGRERFVAVVEKAVEAKLPFMLSF